jgi:hypothetical protein
MKIFKTKEEKQTAKSLKKLNAAFGNNTTLAIWAHFDAAGKRRDLLRATTEEELEAQNGLAFDAMHGRLPPEESKLALLKIANGFMRSARRVGDDAELAVCLPDNKFEEKDITFLETNQLPSLAAVVRAKLG